MRIRCRSDLHREENIGKEGEGTSDRVVVERKARERERERERQRERGRREERKEQKEQLYAHVEREKEMEGTQGGSGRGKSLRRPSGNDVRGLMLARTCVSSRASRTSCTKRALSPATMLRGVVAENLPRSAAAMRRGITFFPSQVRARSRPSAGNLDLAERREFHRTIRSLFPRGTYLGGIRCDFRIVWTAREIAQRRGDASLLINESARQRPARGERVSSAGIQLPLAFSLFLFLSLLCIAARLSCQNS